MFAINKLQKLHLPLITGAPSACASEPNAMKRFRPNGAILCMNSPEVTSLQTAEKVDLLQPSLR